MGLFIRSLLIVMIVKSQAELGVTSSGNQKTVCCELDTSSKIDELESTVKNYLTMVNIELRDTKDQVKELKETVSSELQDMKRQLEMLQSAVTSIVGLLKADATERTATTETVGSIVKDCSDALIGGVTESGVYTVTPLDSGEPVQVYCDMGTDGGGWTVFQRRQDGSVDFYLDFASYSRGFGNLEGEFWLGNDILHRLTAQGEYELRVDLGSFEDSAAYAIYDSFNVADVSDNYRMTLGSYSGTAGDKLTYHNNSAFTTRDRDNDIRHSNCAVDYHGAWWYRSCYRCNLNGIYSKVANGDPQGINWSGFSSSRSLKTTEMKIRSKV